MELWEKVAGLAGYHLPLKASLITDFPVRLFCPPNVALQRGPAGESGFFCVCVSSQSPKQRVSMNDAAAPHFCSSM